MNKNIKVFTNNIDEKCLDQINNISSSKAFKNEVIRIMPDCHAGKGAVIGFTSTFADKIVPNVIGVDIGCGMLCCEIGEQNVDLPKMDFFIHDNIPAGQGAVNENANEEILPLLKQLKMFDKISKKDLEQIQKSIGSLGSGNHFIEVDENEDGEKFLIIHTGSRSLGTKVAEYYQNLAIEQSKPPKNTVTDNIKKAKAEGLSGVELGNFAQEQNRLYKEELELYKNNSDLTFLSGIDAENYLHDMRITQEYARINRETIAKNIETHLITRQKLKPFKEQFHTVHNYIGEDNVIRKGAVSAHKGVKLLIPINMADGSIIAIGKGNPEWNNSAPHGAGRLFSRGEANRKFNMEEYENSMLGIETSTVNKNTLDEAPMAYKPMKEIIENSKDTIEIQQVVKPIYNFKGHNDLPFVPFFFRNTKNNETECESNIKKVKFSL
ncbi:MAG: RtcB family protein [Mycoplasma sp.]